MVVFYPLLEISIRQQPGDKGNVIKSYTSTNGILNLSNSKDKIFPLCHLIFKKKLRGGGYFFSYVNIVYAI